MLLAGTVIGMSGLAVRNVAMPSYIRQHHADRAATMTALYTVSMTIGATLAVRSRLADDWAARQGSPMSPRVSPRGRC